MKTKIFYILKIILINFIGFCVSSTSFAQIFEIVSPIKFSEWKVKTDSNETNIDTALVPLTIKTGNSNLLKWKCQISYRYFINDTNNLLDKFSDWNIIDTTTIETLCLGFYKLKIPFILKNRVNQFKKKKHCIYYKIQIKTIDSTSKDIVTESEDFYLTNIISKTLNSQINGIESRREEIYEAYNRFIQQGLDDGKNRKLKFNEIMAKYSSFANEIDSLAYERDRQNYFEYVMKDNNILFFPNKTSVRVFFGDTLNNDYKYLDLTKVGLSLDGKSSLLSEIISGYAAFLRVGLGLSISNEVKEDSLSNDEITKNALQRIQNGGGNFYFDVKYPIAVYYSSSFINFNSIISSRGALDFQGTKVNDENIGASIFTNMSLNCNIILHKAFIIENSLNFGWIIGNSKFLNNLNSIIVKDGIDEDFRTTQPFLTSLGVGIKIFERLKIGYNIYKFYKSTPFGEGGIINNSIKNQLTISFYK